MRLRIVMDDGEVVTHEFPIEGAEIAAKTAAVHCELWFHDPQYRLRKPPPGRR